MLPSEIDGPEPFGMVRLISGGAALTFADSMFFVSVCPRVSFGVGILVGFPIIMPMRKPAPRTQTIINASFCLSLISILFPPCCVKGQDAAFLHPSCPTGHDGIQGTRRMPINNIY